MGGIRAKISSCYNHCPREFRNPVDLLVLILGTHTALVADYSDTRDAGFLSVKR